MLLRSLVHHLKRNGILQRFQANHNLITQSQPSLSSCWPALFFHTSSSVLSQSPSKSGSTETEIVKKDGSVVNGTENVNKEITATQANYANQSGYSYQTHENPQQDIMDPYPDRIRYRKHYNNPIERTLGILKDDILEFIGQLKYNPVIAIDNNKKKSRNPDKLEIFPSYCDVVIIGGGLVGVSVAYHLQERARDGLRIVVVEKDLSYAKASSALSVGGIRQQFSIPENIILSKYGMDFLQTASYMLATEEEPSPDFGINLHGYLTVATENGMQQLIENYNLQKEYGAHVKLLRKDKLKEWYPWLETEGIEGAVVGVQREGWFDPWSLLVAVARKTKEYGTHYVQGEVVQASVQNLSDYLHHDNQISPVRKVTNISVNLPSGEMRQINCALCVIAAGAWSQEAGSLFGIGTAKSGFLSIPIPVEPRKRYVYCIKSPNGPGLNCPLVINPDGSYFRREGLADLYLCGKSPKKDEEPSNDDLSVDYSFFEETVWPAIASRCQSFEKLKLHSAWSGYYDYNTFDQNAIIGRHPMYSNLFMATGFSGHGVQQATGAGKALSELILDAEYKTINLERFGFERVILNEPIFERCIY